MPFTWHEMKLEVRQFLAKEDLNTCLSGFRIQTSTNKEVPERLQTPPFTTQEPDIFAKCSKRGLPFLQDRSRPSPL